MANIFDRKTLQITNTTGVIYTVPASTKAIIIGFNVSNKTTGAIMVTVDVANANLVTNINIDPGTNLSLLDGKIVLNAGDTVEIISNTATCGDAILSLMEIS